MRHLTILITCLVFIGCSPTATVGRGPLAIKPPAGWTLGRDTTGGADFYSLNTTSGEPGLLMVYKWPAPNRAEEIPNLVRKLADGFLERARGSTEFTLSRDKYELGQFSRERSEGSYAVFQIKEGNTNGVQTLFMMSLEGKIWNGQFTGTAERWKEALKVLMAIKPRD